MQYLLALCVAMVVNAFANLLMKVGMKSVACSGGLLRDGPAAAVKVVLSSPVLLAGLGCFALNVGFYMYALQSRTLKISVAYPMMVGGGYALIALIARFHPSLMERLAWQQIVGVALVLTGIVLIAARSNAGTV